MKSLNDASYNDLEELRALMGELDAQIERYSHVKEYLPEKLTKTIEKLHERYANRLDEIDN